MFLTVTNLLAIEPGYKFCFSSLSSLPPFEGMALFFPVSLLYLDFAAPLQAVAPV